MRLNALFVCSVHRCTYSAGQLKSPIAQAGAAQNGKFWPKFGSIGFHGECNISIKDLRKYLEIGLELQNMELVLNQRSFRDSECGARTLRHMAVFWRLEWSRYVTAARSSGCKQMIRYTATL